MNNADATAIMTANKGHLVTVLLNDDTRFSGLAISVNSKGVNINVDGKTRSFSLTRVADLVVVDDDADDDDDTYGADDNADDAALADLAGFDDDDEITAEDEIAMTGNFDQDYMDGVDTDADEDDADAEDPIDTYGEGLTTRDVAEIVGLSPKELRIILRRLGMGVGRGSQYGLDGNDVVRVQADLARTAAAATNV